MGSNKKAGRTRLDDWPGGEYENMTIHKYRLNKHKQIRMELELWIQL